MLASRSDRASAASKRSTSGMSTCSRSTPSTASHPLWLPALIPNMGAATVSMDLGAKGPVTAQCTACAASTMAIGDAILLLRAGMCDAMVAGGAEAAVSPMGDRRLRGDPRALGSERRPGGREPAVRHRPGRPRDRRGRGRAGGRDARARRASRRHDLCRDRRLRAVGRRLPRDRAGPDRREPGQGNPRWRSGMPAVVRTRSST